MHAHNSALLIITIACIGCIVESYSQGWEFWVPPLIGVALVIIWWVHLTKYRDERFRENVFLFFALIVTFYYGVHPSSYFDAIVISSLLMGVCALLRRLDFLKITLAEFYLVVALQTLYAVSSGTFHTDSLNISRLCLHVIAELCIYAALAEVVKNSVVSENKLERKEKDEETERSDMEDFLVNISHELRTPVNVINGMSGLILKKEQREDVYSIRDAGLRLSQQIVDIQDYSEIQRGDVVLEEDKYMLTSILNDIVMNYKTLGRKRNVELVIDLDPAVPSMMRGDVGKIQKIIIHLLDNAFKFTSAGGVFLKIYAKQRDQGINLVIEVTDTGTGMSELEIEKISKGRFQANSKRNRSTGGIGLGLSIVYGFVRMMDGFVNIESRKNRGTTVRVSVVQEILDPAPCLAVEAKSFFNIAYHVIPEKYKIPAVRDFYRIMASNMAESLRLNLYAAPTFEELKKLLTRGDITHVFMGPEEYEYNPDYFDKLSSEGIVVVVSAGDDFAVQQGSGVIVMPKPLYGLPVVKVLNGDTGSDFLPEEVMKRPELDGVRALIVDDEPMNLVVASGLFREYNMIIDTAESGREALIKYEKNDYDVVFMDHMMPEMDGVEAMKRIRYYADQNKKTVKVIALTANAISGARAMFLKEGFDGFISKPVSISEFERVMNRVMSETGSSQTGVRRHVEIL